MKRDLQYTVIIPATIIAVILGMSSIAANCQPPTAAEVVTLENVACWLGKEIPQTDATATYLCGILGVNGTVSTTAPTITVQVPQAQIALFVAKHKIITAPIKTDAGM
jgi:hypothetical protein